MVNLGWDINERTFMSGLTKKEVIDRLVDDAINIMFDMANDRFDITNDDIPGEDNLNYVKRAKILLRCVLEDYVEEHGGKL